MNILIVYPRPDKSKKPRFGFSYEMMVLATVFSAEHSVTIRDYSCEEYDEKWLINHRDDNSYDVVFVECDSFALKRSQNIENASEIIQLFNGYVDTVAYGNYCYITKKAFPSAKYTIFDNDINKAIDLLNSLSKKEKIPHIDKYDEQPIINRSLLLDIDYYRQNRLSTLLQTAKGCENTCVFCQRKGWQNHYEMHSDDYVIKELTALNDLGIKNVWITDENFTFNLSRAKRLLRKIVDLGLTRNLSLFISSWANIDFDFLKLASESNIRIISFGIETGNDAILKYYRKNIALDSIQAKINYANECGIFTVGNFIIGAPMENSDTITQTFDLIRRCQFDQVNIKILDYMIGSELYSFLPECMQSSDSVFACKENGLTNFTLDEMIKIKSDFLKEYYQEHQAVISRKISKYGKPYSMEI